MLHQLLLDGTAVRKLLPADKRVEARGEPRSCSVCRKERQHDAGALPFQRSEIAIESGTVRRFPPYKVNLTMRLQRMRLCTRSGQHFYLPRWKSASSYCSLRITIRKAGYRVQCP